MPGSRSVQALLGSRKYLAAHAPARFLPAETPWLRTVGSIIAGQRRNISVNDMATVRAIIADSPGPGPGRVLLDGGPVERAGPVCSVAGIGPDSGGPVQGRIGVGKQAPGFLVRVGDGSLPEFGGQGGQHILRAGG